MTKFQDSIETEAPPQTAFEYLTINEGVTAWMGQYADLNPTLGKQFAADITGHPVRGEYLVVEPFQYVVISWGFAGGGELPAGTSRVEFILTPITVGMRMDLRHLNLPEPAIPEHAHDWTHFMPRLKVAGVGGDAGPDRWQPLTG